MNDDDNDFIDPSKKREPFFGRAMADAGFFTSAYSGVIS